MAGTDRTRAAVSGGPAVVLVAPQLGENIGSAARAMYNFGLTDLRLVAPRDGWPNEKAIAMASGAAPVIEAARVFDSVASAVADLTFLAATTARDRHMVKPVLTPEAAAAALREAVAAGGTAGLLFGPERAGLGNDHTVLAQAIVTVPVNPAFASLNLAQAVAVLAYEWFKAGDATPPETLVHRSRLATGEELLGLFIHLEDALADRGFLNPPEKRPAMIRNLRNMIHRMQPTHQDVQTLRGVIASLVRPKA